MSMVGTFDSFTSARLGIYAAQHGLRTTGNNISNINTMGYTRQRVDQYSFKVGANDRYRSVYDNHVGAGALVKGINQIRDPYLDIRYRNVSTETHHYDTWLAGLQNIASILDEVGKGENYGDGLLYAQLQDLAEKLRAYGANPTTLNERLVRDSATSLTALFHNAANALEEEFNETEKEFYENISSVNEMLTNIRDLNKSIREAEIHGDMALEMRDERNRQIDALSQYLDIKVEYSYEDVGAGVQVEKLTISLNNKNPDSSIRTDESILVDGLYATQLSVPEMKPVLAKTYEEAYLHNFLYVRKVADGSDALNEFLEAHPDLAGSLTKVTENGTDYYLIGTNDADLDGVVKEENDNYTIHLSQLVNSKGELWESSTTRWEEVAGTPITYNKWGITVGGAGLNAAVDNTFSIFGTPCTVVADGTDPVGPDEITESDAHNPTKFAKFVVDHLSDELKSNYNVSVGTNGQIIFTAKNPDYTTAPSLTVTPEGNTIITASAAEKLSPKVEYGPPDPANTADAGETFDEHGNVIKSVKYVQSADGRWYRLQVDTEYTHEVALDDNDLRGILQAQREMLTEEGEFASAKDVLIDEDALTKRGIRYYQKSLDLLAQKFAEAYNKLNQGYAYNQNGNYIYKNGEELMLWDDDTGEFAPVSATDGPTEGQMRTLTGNGFTLESWLEMKSDYPMGGILFSNRGDGNDTAGITAKNISISYDWSNGLTSVIPTYEMLFKDDGSGGLTNSTQPSNINHMIAMIEKSLTYDPRDLYGSDAIGPVLFEGSFNDMFSNMMAVEGEDASITNVRLTTAALRLEDIDYSREGVSGVDLNDEAMNMITYQKAMGAAMRLMTVIDSMLDRLINNTGVTT